MALTEYASHPSAIRRNPGIERNRTDITTTYFTKRYANDLPPTKNSYWHGQLFGIFLGAEKKPNGQYLIKRTLEGDITEWPIQACHSRCKNDRTKIHGSAQVQSGKKADEYFHSLHSSVSKRSVRDESVNNVST
uniref:NAC domain-containing protein n=1 Tax=Syphacia muris TaxID=451379 RepID=A0A0N5AUL4_9BILA